MRNIVTVVALLFTVSAFAFMAKLDGEAERFKQIEEMIDKSQMEVHIIRALRIAKSRNEPNSQKQIQEWEFQGCRNCRSTFNCV